MIAYYNDITLGKKLYFTPNEPFSNETVVDIVIKNNKRYQYHYSERTFYDKCEIDKLINYLTRTKGFVFDKTNKSTMELVDSKTGMTRYIFYPDNIVECIVEEEISNKCILH